MMNITIPSQYNGSYCNGTNIGGWQIDITSRISLIIAYSLISLIGIPGNFSVLVILSNKKYERTSGDTFLMSLAVFDILASLFIPLVMIHDMVDMKWNFGYAGCKLLPAFNVLTLFASAWSLVLISLDRLRVILYPMHAKLSNHKKCLCIVAIWIMTIVVSSPYAYFHSIHKDGVCWVSWNTPIDQFVYFFVLFIIICIIPTVVMVVAYAAFVCELRKSKLDLGKLQNMIRHKENAKVTKMYILVVVVFTSLVTPYFVNLMVIVYGEAFDVSFLQNNIETFYKLNLSLFTMAAFNSCANCLIYSKLHSEFRKRTCKMNWLLQDITMSKQCLFDVRKTSLVGREIQVAKQDNIFSLDHKTKNRYHNSLILVSSFKSHVSEL